MHCSPAAIFTFNSIQQIQWRLINIHPVRHKRHGFVSWVGKIPWRRAWQPAPVFLPRKSHGQRSLVGYSPWGCIRVGQNCVTEHACCVRCISPDPLLGAGQMDCCCCSVAKLYPILCDPMDCSTPGFPVLHYLLEFAQTHGYYVSDAIQLSVSSSVIPFSSCLQSFPVLGSFESVLQLRWLKYWSFSFSPSNEYWGLISFRTD